LAQKLDLGLRVFIIEVSIIHTHTQPTGLPNRRDQLFEWLNDVCCRSQWALAWGRTVVRRGTVLLARVQDWTWFYI